MLSCDWSAHPVCAGSLVSTVCFLTAARHWSVDVVPEARLIIAVCHAQRLPWTDMSGPATRLRYLLLCEWGALRRAVEEQCQVRRGNSHPGHDHCYDCNGVDHLNSIVIVIAITIVIVIAITIVIVIAIIVVIINDSHFVIIMVVIIENYFVIIFAIVVIMTLTSKNVM